MEEDSLVAWGKNLPQMAKSWPVRWCSSEEEVMSHPHGLISSTRDLIYYQYGLKILSASECYGSLRRGQHRFFADLLKRQGRYPKTLLDPTAGWGREALSAALLGISVTAVEKQPLPVCFLSYAREFLYPKVAANLEIIHACFSQHRFEPQDFEMVFLDPLFFEQKKTASKKVMCLLYDPDADSAQQNKALEQGLSRLQPQTLIVKQPLKAPELILEQTLRHSRSSRSCRYDIFYINAEKHSYAKFFS